MGWQQLFRNFNQVAPVVAVLAISILLSGCLRDGDNVPPNFQESHFELFFDLDEGEGEGLTVLVSGRDAARIGIPAEIPAELDSRTGRYKIDEIMTEFPEISGSRDEVCFDDPLVLEDAVFDEIIEIFPAGQCLGSTNGTAIQGLRDPDEELLVPGVTNQ